MVTPLLEDIKHNCDISDAQFWGYFSICGLLMRYRDLYRSEQGLEPWAPIDREAIARWIQHKEARWPELEDRPFRNLTIEGVRRDPFDLDAVNGFLERQDLIYGAGYGMYLKPSFFVARAVSASEVEGHRVVTTDREVVRDLFTSPAMLQGGTIFLRLEPLKAYLWDRFVQIAPGRCAALAGAFRLFGIEPGRSPDRAFEEALGRMASVYAAVLLRHELAESAESAPDWRKVLADVRDRKVELYMRSVQDVLADTADRGPLRRIIVDRDERSLALYVGLLDGYRRVLFPELRRAYSAFEKDKNWQAVDEARLQCYARQQELKRSVLELAGSGDGEERTRRIRRLMPE